MLKYLTILVALTCFSSTQAEESFIGTNLQGIHDYSGDWPFVDRMKSSRQWITFDSTGQDKKWNTKIPFNTDKNGYPLQIPFDPDDNGPIPPQAVRTFLFNQNDNYPAGTYTVIFEGKGKIHFRVDATCPSLPNGQCIFSKPDTIHQFEVTKATKGGIRLKILESDALDHIRNIRVYMPGFNESNGNEVFHPLFVDRLSGFKVLRFMVWASTNYSKVKTWNERVKPEYYSFGGRGPGVPFEHMIALANKLKADPWFTIPTYVDDDFVVNLAKLINDQLDPERKLYIEYSNEVWNSVFQQSKYATIEGKQLAKSFGLKVLKKEHNAVFYAKRSAEIFHIFENELLENRHLIKVVSGQGMNPWVLKWVLKWLDNEKINPHRVKPDAMAIGFYIGGPSADNLLTKDGVISRKQVTLLDVNSITISDILSEVEKDLFEKRMPKLLEHKKLAEKHDLDLLAYEGGQALKVGRGFASDVVYKMTDKLIKANRSPGMKRLYKLMFDTWFQSGGGDFINFSYISKPSRHGMWGILEYQSQPFEEAFKYQAVIEEVNKRNTSY